MCARPGLAGLTLAMSLVFAATGCGSDTVASSAPSNGPLCDGVAQLDALDSPGGPTEPTPENLKAFAAQVSPILGEIRTGLDGRLGNELSTLDRAVASLAQGDGSVLEDPAVDPAIGAVRQVAAETCRYNRLGVTATDFAFEMPKQVQQGRVLAQLANDGQEPHVLLLMRRTTEGGPTNEELVSTYVASFDGGPPAEGVEDVSGGGPFAMPGAPGSHVWDLPPGSYVYFCPIPSGEDGSGPPHFSLGMLGELTVQE